MLQLQLACESRLPNKTRCHTAHNAAHLIVLPKNIGFFYSRPTTERPFTNRRCLPTRYCDNGLLRTASTHCLWLGACGVDERTRQMQLAVELACSVSQREWSVPRPRGSPASNARERNLLLAAPTTGTDWICWPGNCHESAAETLCHPIPCKATQSA